jgi:hypothetical protein
MDFLKKQAKAPAPKKASGTPILDLPQTDELKKALKTFVEQKQIEKNAETTRKQAETVLRPQCEAARETHCTSEGKFSSSVKVKCGDVGPITFVNQNKYSKIELDKEEELRSTFGQDYDRCFSMTTEINLTEKAMKDIETLLPKLMEAVGGEEQFASNFEVTQFITPTEFMHEQRVLDPKIGGMVKKAIEEGLVKQSTPFFVV